MSQKINPINLIKTAVVGDVLKSPITVCIVGVFKPSHSSSIPFSEGFKNLPNVKSVIEFDYRDFLARKNHMIVQHMIHLSGLCDLMIIMKGNTIPLQAIELASKKCKILLWYMDWYPQLKSSRTISGGNFCHYRTGTGFDTAKMWAMDSSLPTYHILDGADPNVYTPTGEEKIYDVIFIGGKDVERKVIYDFLNRQGFKVKFFGPGFTKFISPDEFKSICSKSKIVLNISRGNYEGYSSLRLWSVLSCGSMVLTKHIPGMVKHMKLNVGVNIEEFKNIVELKNKIIYYLKNEKEREVIAKLGRQFVLDNRTWNHTAKEIVDIVTSEKPCSNPTINNMNHDKKIPTKKMIQQRRIRRRRFYK